MVQFFPHDPFAMTGVMPPAILTSVLCVCTYFHVCMWSVCVFVYTYFSVCMCIKCFSCVMYHLLASGGVIHCVACGVAGHRNYARSSVRPKPRSWRCRLLKGNVRCMIWARSCGMHMPPLSIMSRHSAALKASCLSCRSESPNARELFWPRRICAVM